MIQIVLTFTFRTGLIKEDCWCNRQNKNKITQHNVVPTLRKLPKDKENPISIL